MHARREARKAEALIAPLTDLGRLHPVLGPMLEQSLLSAAPGSAGRAVLAITQNKGILDGIHKDVGLARAWSKGYLNYAWARVAGVD